MAKYLSTVFHSIVSKPITVPKSVHTFLTSKYCSNLNESHYNNDNHHEKDGQIGQRLLKVAIIGAPNAGKSSTINSIIQRNASKMSYYLRK